MGENAMNLLRAEEGRERDGGPSFFGSLSSQKTSTMDKRGAMRKKEATEDEEGPQNIQST